MKIKICGLTRRQDAELAVELGAWALGFVFYDKSPRAASPEKVREILRGLNPDVRTVGVFVDADIERIRNVAERSRIRCVQLHGDETLDFCKSLRESLPGVDVIKALRPRSAEDLATVAAYAEVCEEILLDAYVPGARGGTGATGDWDLAIRAKSYGPIILAGGLNPDNIRAAIDRVGPAAVDASSGLEEAPGIKSAEKLRKFFSNAARMESK